MASTGGPSGWTALLSAPGVLIVLGLRGRPALLLPAGLILVPLSVVSFAGVLLPLLVPAVLSFGAYARRARAPRPRFPTAMTALVVVGLMVLAVMTLFVHQDPRSYDVGYEQGSTSDVLTGIEALVMTGLVGLAIGLGWAIAAPRQIAASAASRQYAA